MQPLWSHLVPLFVFAPVKLTFTSPNKLYHIYSATYLADHPDDGALIMLPQMRPPPKSGKRSDLPVFANLADSLSSSDVQYFQTIHGKKIYDKPGLKTLYAFEGSEYVYRLVREWDDLAHPMVTKSIRPAYDERFTKRRRRGLKKLVEQVSSGSWWIWEPTMIKRLRF